MTDAPSRRRSLLSWRLTALAATVPAVAFLFRWLMHSGPSAAPGSSPVPRPVATLQDEVAIGRLLERVNRRTLTSNWLETLMIVVAAVLVITLITVASTGRTTLVLVHDVRQGDLVRAEDVVAMRLPRLDHTFLDARTLTDVVAMRDLSGGRVVRTNDLARSQAVATANIAAGELLDPAKNIAFKPLAYDVDAVTPTSATRKRAAQFIVSGSLIRTGSTTDAPKVAPKLAPDDVEVPMRAFAGALAPGVGTEVIVVATPRGGSPSTVFEHVRVVSVDVLHEPATFVVAMSRVEAMRFAALPAAELTMMRARR